MAISYDRMTRAELVAEIRRLHHLVNDDGNADILRAELNALRQQTSSMREEALKAAQRLLEESRDAYAELYDFAPVAYLTLDRHGIVVTANLTACNLLAIERLRLIGLPFLGFVDTEDRPVLLEHLRRCREGADQVTSELRISSRTKKLVPVLMTSRIPSSGLDMIRTAVTDLTERRRAEAEIRQLNAELEKRVQLRTSALENANDALKQEIYQRQAAETALQEANRHKDEFLAMLGHELRNPLGPISNAIEVWRMSGEEKPELREMQNIVARQVRHISRLVDDLLDISRISRGKIILHQDLIDMVKLVQEVIDDMRSELQARELQVEVCLNSAPLWVRGDATRLTQVVTNLLNNAIKFTPQGGQIIVRAETNDARSSAQISIRDTGIGIEPAMLGQVFDAFVQSTQGLDRRHGGLGLGLALVRGLVQLHGGSVHVSSAGKDMGSQFIINLPLALSFERIDTKHAVPVPTGCYRILVIDDQRDATIAMRVLLTRLGHEVAVAENGEKGVELAREFQPDVIFSDIGLPDIDGYEVARQVRDDAQLRSTCMVALTGYGQSSDQERAYDAGFHHHVTKPVSISDLCRILEGLPSGETLNRRQP